MEETREVIQDRMICGLATILPIDKFVCMKAYIEHLSDAEFNRFAEEMKGYAKENCSIKEYPCFAIGNKAGGILMDVALLNVKITFQKNSVEVDAIGNHKNGWTDYYTCHATVSGESGNEKHTAGTTVEDSDLAFTIRWCRKAAEIDVTGYRVVFHGELYNITSVDHMNYKKKSLKFRCQKVRR